MSSKGRGQHRKNCLLAFIEDCLNDSSMNHLIRWSDKSKEIFQVLWVHAGRSNYYRKTQGCLFDLYREYRGRGMTSDPKQAFRMALKKSPCIKAVSSPNIQEDWRTFQIVLKCHQQSLDNSVCVPGEDEKSHLKMSKSENVKIQQNYIFSQDSAKEDVDKRISPVNKITIPDANYEKSLNSPTYKQNESYASFGFQNNCKLVCQNNVDKQINSSFNNNEKMNSSIGQEDGTVCCKNPCCRYSSPYDVSDQIVRNVGNKIPNQLFSQRSSSAFSPSIANNPYSMSLDDTHILGSYFPTSIKAQGEFGPFALNTNTTNWITNTKPNISQCPWKSHTSQSDNYSLSFQTSYECGYDNESTNESTRNATKYCQSFESDLLTSCFKPGEDLSHKNFYLSDYDYISQDTEQDSNFMYSKQDLYDKDNAQLWQNQQQQMIPCSWI